ncbi:enoyl-CoA hydratase [Roseibium sp. RKSG952]|uniref:enoyl-CoA hydratase n=1 Tax=Roseibium sp. RKSG952 TaxID=2529384 RepID=UPI001AD8C31C
MSPSDINSLSGQYSGFHTRVSGPVAFLEIRNPDRKNALTLKMWQDLPGTLKKLEQEPDIRILVLSGSGPEAFSAGADISEFDETRSDAAKAANYDAVNLAAFRAVKRFKHPTIAMIRGHCLGGGVGLIAACDLRICDETARFAIPAGRLGLAYPPDGIADIVAATGSSHAKRLLFTAGMIDADKAMTFGLVDEVVAPEALESHVEQLCVQIARNAPLTLQAAKLAINALEAGAEPGLKTQAGNAADACFASRDFAEGRAAFKDKRVPVFKGC